MILNSKIIGKNKKILIILHGLFGSLDNWYSIAKEFSLYYQVHILDLRNHGKSFHDKNHSYELMSDDLYNYINYHKIKEPIILGHSMGGKTAMVFAFRYPDYIKKLIVLDISPKKYINPYSELISTLVEINKAKLNSRKKAQQILESKYIDIKIIKFLLKNLFWKGEELKFRFNINAIEKSIEDLMNFDYLQYSWTGSCYFIRGGKSNYILDSDNTLIKKYFLNSKLITIDNANHWVHFDQKEKFLDIVKNIIV